MPAVNSAKERGRRKRHWRDRRLINSGARPALRPSFASGALPMVRVLHKPIRHRAWQRRAYCGHVDDVGVNVKQRMLFNL